MPSRRGRPRSSTMRSGRKACASSSAAHAVAGELDLVALHAQRALQDLGDLLVVLDDEHADGAARRLPSRQMVRRSEPDFERELHGCSVLSGIATGRQGRDARVEGGRARCRPPRTPQAARKPRRAPRRRSAPRRLPDARAAPARPDRPRRSSPLARLLRVPRLPRLGRRPRRRAGRRRAALAARRRRTTSCRSRCSPRARSSCCGPCCPPCARSAPARSACSPRSTLGARRRHARPRPERRARRLVGSPSGSSRAAAWRGRRSTGRPRTLLGDVGAHILALFLFLAGVLLLTGASVAGVLQGHDRLDDARPTGARPSPRRRAAADELRDREHARERARRRSRRRRSRTRPSRARRRAARGARPSFWSGEERFPDLYGGEPRPEPEPEPEPEPDAEPEPPSRTPSRAALGRGPRGRAGRHARRAERRPGRPHARRAATARRVTDAPDFVWSVPDPRFLKRSSAEASRARHRRAGEDRRRS